MERRKRKKRIALRRKRELHLMPHLIIVQMKCNEKRDLLNLLLLRVPVLLFCRYTERSHSQEDDEPVPLLVLKRSVHTTRRFGPPQKQSLRVQFNLLDMQ